MEDGNRIAELIQSTFLKLKKHARFDTTVIDELIDDDDEERDQKANRARLTKEVQGLSELRIGYTINLNLPATTNAEVFDAIFQSLRRNLLRDE